MSSTEAPVHYDIGLYIKGFSIGYPDDNKYILYARTCNYTWQYILGEHPYVYTTLIGSILSLHQSQSAAIIVS